MTCGLCVCHPLHDRFVRSTLKDASGKLFQKEHKKDGNFVNSSASRVKKIELDAATTLVWYCYDLDGWGSYVVLYFSLHAKCMKCKLANSWCLWLGGKSLQSRRITWKHETDLIILGASSECKPQCTAKLVLWSFIRRGSKSNAYLYNRACNSCSFCILLICLYIKN